MILIMAYGNFTMLTSLIYLLDYLKDKAVEKVKEKLFKNYEKWCKFLHKKSNLR